MWKFTGLGMLPLTSMSIYQVYTYYVATYYYAGTVFHGRLPIEKPPDFHTVQAAGLRRKIRTPDAMGLCFLGWIKSQDPEAARFSATAPSCSDVAIPSGVRFWHELRTCPGHFHNNFLGILRCLPWEPSLVPMKIGGKCRVIETWFGRFRMLPQVANLAGKMVIKPW